MQTHYATLAPVRIGRDGNVIDHKEAVSKQLIFENQIRIVPDASIGSSADYPTIQQYLALEAAAGFQPVQVGQTFVVTYKS